MKKFLKIGCLGVIGVVVLLIILVAIVGDDDTEKVPVTSDGNTTEKPVASEGEKAVSVNREFKINGLNITIGDIVITKKDIKIDMTILNTTDDQISFFPDQGSLIVGNTQVDANMFMTKGDVSGDIHGGVEKTGTIKFLAQDGKEFSPSEINEIKLAFGMILNDKSYESEDFNETIVFD